MTLLKVNAVSKSFGGLRALSNVSFEVEKGEVLGLMGANGAGKTTLFSIVAGHQKADEGSVVFDNQTITNLSIDRICRLGVARTFQIVRPFAGLSVLDNVETALMFASADNALKNSGSLRHRAMQVLEETGLVDQAGKLAGTLTLSGRKRLEVARALGTEPSLILLDEVMAGLTPAEVLDMLETVRAIQQSRNLSIVVVEHVVRALTELSDRMIVLHHGELIAGGSPQEIINDAAVRAVYFGEESA